MGVTGVGAVTALNIVGSVYNQSGNVTVSNSDGGIAVTGTVRGATVNIDSAAGLSINSDDILHTNRDPRQYTSYDYLARLAKLGSSSYNSQATAVANQIDTAANQDVSKIQALGDININARIVNLNGTIESGIKDYALDITSSFASLAAAARAGRYDIKLDEDLAGVSFSIGSAGGQEFSARYDYALDAIVIDELQPQAGKVYITGTVISTGNGEIKVASGYASLDVDIDLGSGADMDVVFDGVDLTENREGLIQITDINRLTVDTNNSSTVSVGFGSDVRTTYTLNGSNISKQVEGGRIELLDDRYSLVYDSASTSSVSGTTTTWNPITNSRYVWIEGQAKAEETQYKYEKKSFTWSTIESWNDGVVGDSSYKWKTTRLLDSTPLLESESVVVPGDGSDEYNSAWTGTGIHIGYEEKVDLSQAINENDVVKLVNMSSGVRNAIQAYLGENPSTSPNGDVGGYYEFQGTSEEYINLWKEDYTDTTRWTKLSGQPSGWSANLSTGFKSDSIRYDYDLESWTTGGGYMRHKTQHKLVTTTLGKKDYYTYSMDADEAINVVFDAASSQTLSINTDGNVLLRGNLEMGHSNATVDVTAGGRITSDGAAGILGANDVDLDAAGNIDLTLEGSSTAYDVYTTEGNIDLTVVSETAGAADLVVTRVQTDDGDITLTVGDDLTAEDGNSIIRGDHVRLIAQQGSMGTSGQALRVDASDEGGLAALAASNIYITETDGDMRLIDPVGVGTSASVRSTGGDVTLSTVDGNILDAWAEQVDALTDAEATAKAQQLGIDSGSETLALINSQLDSEEQNKTTAYHQYWTEFRGAVQASSDGLITISSTDLQVTLSSISDGDLAGSDYQQVTLTESDDAQSVDLLADQLVRDNQGNYYTVDADITFALADANLSGESGFTASTATYDAAAGVVQTLHQVML